MLRFYSWQDWENICGTEDKIWVSYEQGKQTTALDSPKILLKTMHREDSLQSITSHLLVFRNSLKGNNFPHQLVYRTKFYFGGSCGADWRDMLLEYFINETLSLTVFSANEKVIMPK